MVMAVVGHGEAIHPAVFRSVTEDDELKDVTPRAMYYLASSMKHRGET